MTRTDTALPDWLVIGATVFDIGRGRSATAKTVKRITATQIVCDGPNGTESKYRRKNLSRIGSDAWSGSSLVALDDPAVQLLLGEARRRNLAYAIEDASRRIRQAKSDEDARGDAWAVYTRLKEYLGA